MLFRSFGTNTREENNVLQFPIAAENLGSHYNPKLSTFICPFNGTYEFSLRLKFHASIDPDPEATLYVNNDVLTKFSTYSMSPREWYRSGGAYDRVGSDSAVEAVRARAGDRVWVAGRSSDIQMGRMINSFSGWLIHNDEI